LLVVFEPEYLNRSAVKNKTKKARHSTAKKAMLEAFEDITHDEEADDLKLFANRIRE
jgi:hypothetical protein